MRTVDLGYRKQPLCQLSCTRVRYITSYLSIYIGLLLWLFQHLQYSISCNLTLVPTANDFSHAF